MSTPSRPIRIELPRPHANQRKIVSESDRFNVVNCGRRWGKTVMGKDRAVCGRKGLLAGFPVGWFAPEYKLLREAWRELRDTLKPITVKASDQDKRIELVNGAVLEGWAFDRSPDAGRSRKYGTVVIDEAAHCEHLETAWGKAIRPTLTDYRGDAWFISSPNGPSYFRKLYKRGGIKEGWRSWTQTSYDNPFILGSEIDSARDDIGDWAFEQEYLAVFHDDVHDGLLKDFWVDRLPSVHVEACSRRERGAAGNRRVLAVDLGEGTGRDRTVLAVVDRYGVVHLEESSQVGIPEAAQKIDVLCKRFAVRQENVVFDAGGRGKDLPRYLEAYRITEAAPYFGGGKGGHRHYNRRSKCAWMLRQRLDPDRPEPIKPVELPRDHKPSPFDPPLPRGKATLQPPFSVPPGQPWWPSMAEELKSLRYHMDGARIKLERKEDMAKRLGRSPDLVDVLLMAMSLLGDE